jgi:hypothetical protein
MKWLLVLAVVTLHVVLTSAQAQTYYVDMNNASCSDTPGSGTVGIPYCTVTYAESVAVAGDTFLIQAGRYDEGAITFNANGTSGAKITYRAVGDVFFGHDIIDENFIAEPGVGANVYSAAFASTPGQVSQLRYAPIVVDDPNKTYFEMIESDGPIRLSPVTTDAALAANEGTWRLTGGRLYVHAYGHRVPSTTNTDFVIGIAGDVALTVSANHNIFDGFRILFTFTTGGSNNLYTNLSYEGQALALTGTTNTATNIEITHVIVRDQANWTWHQSATGTAMTATGSNHRVNNAHIFHNWNSSIGGDGTPGLIIDGLRLHGAPNHCGSGVGTGVTLRNAVFYNCQDYFYVAEGQNILIEHMVSPSGFSSGHATATTPIGPVTIRNSIFSGSFAYTVAHTNGFCQYENGSILENNVISTNAMIERCGTGVEYPILEYVSLCNAGALTNCMTIRNNTLVDPSTWTSVIVGGMWSEAHGDSWNVNLVAGSPAIDRGIASGTLTDLIGVTRPQGAAPDAGVYEGIGSATAAPRSRLRLKGD